MRLPIAALAAALAVTGCGKSVELGELPSSIGAPELEALCGNAARRWTFRQPDAEISRAVDLLFVVDTSASMDAELRKIVSTIPAFTNELPRDGDFRIAVMLAHGGASPYSGRLYAPGRIPKVLSSKTRSLPQIQDDLSEILDWPMNDDDEANGEMLFYSLGKALTPSRLAEARALGFFRPEAALSVIFVSDENDGCFMPDDHGYLAFPHYVPSRGGAERIAYRRYCGGVTGASLASSLRRLKGEKPVLFGTITHVDPARVPRETEDAVGHGQLELVQSSPDGVAIDLAETTYSPGLAKLGDVVSTSLKLRTVFTLTGADGIKKRFIRVSVDGAPVVSSYDEATFTVQVQASDAGRAGSLVEIVGCHAP